MTEPGSDGDPERTVVSFVVAERDERLDKLIGDRIPGLSRTQGQRLIEHGQVAVDGQPRKASYRVAPGERITVEIPPQEPTPPVRAQPIALDIVHEDEHLLVVNKPAGMVVHPAPGHREGTLVNALLAHYPPIAEVGPRSRAGIVHRLDKETSGVLLVAKTKAVRQALQEQFKAREVEKTYVALVHGAVEPPEGIIEVPVGRDPGNRQRMAPVADGRYARTRYRAVEALGDATLLEVEPHTGRTHQIRVHLAWMGYPVVGDTTYGRRDQDILEGRHFLHASRLRFRHPVTEEQLTSRAPIPQELERVLERLRR